MQTFPGQKDSTVIVAKEDRNDLPGTTNLEFVDWEREPDSISSSDTSEEVIKAIRFLNSLKHEDEITVYSPRWNMKIPPQVDGTRVNLVHV